ncbi:MAG: aminopeptidase P family N-terminal domain-containing protein [Mogibacterium sp.]|nr:aminopeptidase P family N-terminal domain-containing protein [Mogibacterium sp.]
MNQAANRISRLRDLMAENNFDAYIIPTADYHQSEYVGEYFKARQFITGFTGSYGTAAITSGDAGLWTDGRYFTQAARELEGSGVRLMKMFVDDTPSTAEWLADKVPSGGKVAFDGRVLSVEEGMELEQAFEGRGISLVYMTDLISEVWEDRPEMSCKPCFYLDEKWTGESTAHKLSRVRSKMEESGAGVHIIASLDDICWLLNFRGDDIDFFPLTLSYCMVWMDHVDLYIDESKLNDEILAHFAQDNVLVHPYNDIYRDAAAIASDETVLIDPMKLNYALYKSLSCNIVTSQNPTILMKAMKNPVEISNIRAAEIKDSVALTKFIHWVKTNYDKITITELSASDKLTSLRREQEGYIRDSFEPLQAFGEHAAMMHYSPSPETDVVLKEGGMLLSDTGGGYYEGSTDITRTTVLGHISPELKKYYTAVFRSMQHLAAANFLYGNHGWSLDVLCRQPIWDLNLDYQCGTGHGFGYLGSIHEPPTGFRWYIVPSKNEHHQFEEGMCVTIEPGIYEEGDFGIRIENNVVTVKGEKNKYGQFMHFEMLTYVPIDLDAIDPDELTKSEREWLNDYHSKCYDKLSPFMTEEENEWLKKYTRAI